MEYAKQNDGETYTGIPWKFHNFGPWSNIGFLRINPALQAIGARQINIPSKHENDIVRWSIQNDRLFNKLSDKLPLTIVHSLQRNVHRFTGITEDLLHFVYNTRPILQARPGDLLDFSAEARLQAEYDTDKEKNGADKGKKITVRQKKKKRQALEQFRQEFRKRLKEKKKKRKIRPRPPRYDAVFYEGLKTINALAGREIPLTEGIVQFSDDIWKSKARFDPDVS
ncbi:hypothetical protein QUF76_16675 [Desulfobacterales bacterium HSG16]|nr:hypothetical protein [Desulfobacterales bacterium HSG16]